MTAALQIHSSTYPGGIYDGEQTLERHVVSGLFVLVKPH